MNEFMNKLMANKKVKILYIMPRLVAGGAEKMVLYYARLLNPEKFEVAVASTVDEGALRPLFEAAKIKLFVGLSRSDGRFAVARKLRIFARDFQPDIIHTHLLGGDIFGYLFKAFWRPSALWISTQHNVEFRTPWFRRWIWKGILRRADKVIAVADKVERYDRKYFKLSQKSLAVLKNGIETSLLSSIKRPIGETKPWQLGIVGRLEKQKGHIFLFKALAKVKEIDWQLNIFGDGTEKDALLELAEEEGIADYIVWHGVVSDPVKIYSSIDILIQPSLWEGLSLVIMEAMAAGRAIIASEPAGEELIKNKLTGLLVAPGDTEIIITALNYALSHPEEIRTMASAARSEALKHFDIVTNVGALEKIYESLK